MSEYKDTLKIYDELLAKGTPEPQAREFAERLGSVANVIDEFRCEVRNVIDEFRKDNVEFKNSFNVILSDIKKDMFWMRAIGAAMIVACLSNGFFGWLGK